MTNNFHKALLAAYKGDEIVYHTGFHCTESLEARKAYRAYEAGSVILYQRRRKDKQIDYVAKVIRGRERME
jgi:hypothetical protein